MIPANETFAGTFPPPLHFIPIFQTGFPHAPIVELANAGHFC
jgi:hypothetical protein